MQRNPNSQPAISATTRIPNTAPTDINDVLAAALAQLGWVAKTEQDEDWLNELALNVHQDLS